MEIHIHEKAFVATIIAAAVIAVVVALTFITEGMFLALLFFVGFIGGILWLIYYTAKQIYEEQEYYERRKKEKGY